MKKILEVEVEFTPSVLAQAFMEMHDAEQADFFEECAEIRKQLQADIAMDHCHYIAQALRHRECNLGMEMLKDIVGGLGDEK